MLESQYLVLTKLTQMLIKKGKKAKAFKIILVILKKLREKQLKNFDAYLIINKAIKYLKPLVYVQKVRKGRKVFYLPKVVKIEKKINICLYWLLTSVNKRKERKIQSRITKEFLDCFFNKGQSILKKRSLYKTLSSNRPFLYFLKKRRKK